MSFDLNSVFDKLAPAPSGYGPWEQVTPLVQRRRKPDGSYESRPMPGMMARKPAAVDGGDFSDVQSSSSSTMATPGNIDLKHRPSVRNADGTASTVRSMSFGTDEGEVLVPTVSDDGRIMSPAEAFAAYRKTGRHLGIFPSEREATAYAKKLHYQQARLLDKRVQIADALARGDLGAVAPPDTSAGAITREALKTAGTAWMRNLTTAPEQVEMALDLPRVAIKRLVGEKAVPEAPAARRAAGALLDTINRTHQQQTERLATATQDLPEPAARMLYATAEFGAGVADPTNLPNAAAASRVRFPGPPLAEEAMAARIAGKTPGVLEALAESAELRPEAGALRVPEWFRRLMGKAAPLDEEAYLAKRDGFMRTEPPADVSADIPGASRWGSEGSIERVGQHADDAAQSQALGMRTSPEEGRQLAHEVRRRAAPVAPQVPRWAASHEDGVANFSEFIRQHHGPLEAADLPFDPRSPLPLTRWGVEGDTGGAHFDLGDTTRWQRTDAARPAFGGPVPRAEYFAPENPLVRVGYPGSANIEEAAAAGHDAILTISPTRPELVEVVKTPLAGPGIPRTSPYAAGAAPEKTWIDYLREPSGDETGRAPVRFRTAKGSEYEVLPDGRTVRNKAQRPEHPGDFGPQPPSEATFYVAPEHANALGEIQARGGPARAVVLSEDGGHAAIKYLEGSDAGKIERRTVVPVERTPRVGALPVELWKDGRRVHFGNPITDIHGVAKGFHENADDALRAMGMEPAQSLPLGRAQPPAPPMYHVVTGGQWDGGDVLPLSDRLDALEEGAARESEYTRLGQRWPDLIRGEDPTDPESWLPASRYNLEEYATRDGRQVHLHNSLEEAQGYAKEYGGEILRVDSAGLRVGVGSEYPHPVVDGPIPASALQRLQQGGELDQGLLARGAEGGEGRLAGRVGDEPTVLGAVEDSSGVHGQQHTAAPRPMSTKGITNVAGMQPELQALARENEDLIWQARGEVRPVSVYHDAKALADETGLTLDDFIQTPAGRTWNDKEMAFGRSLLGGLRERIKATADQVVAGQMDAEAGRTMLAADREKLAHVLASLQGHGATPAGRALRSLQESVDPFQLAATPTEKLQVGLIKRYQDQIERGAAGLPEVAKIEQKALRSLQKDAAAAARKTKRAATRETLDTEFSGLSAEFGKLANRPRMGLDPELVAHIGKMAQNRLRAGATTVEEIADQVYQAARPHIEGLALADVKAAIVQHALEGGVEKRAAAKAGKVPSLLDPVQSALSKRYKENLSDDVIKRISQLDADRPEDLINFLRTMEKPKFRDYASSYWYGSVLAGPKTLLKNGIGNAVKLAGDTAMRPLVAPVEQALSRLQGRVPERYARETIPATVGLFKGLPKGFERFAYVIKHGYDPERLVRELTTGKSTEKFMPLDAFLLSQNKGVRRAGAALNYGPRLLEATDALFKSIAESSERYAWATRKAIQEGHADVPGRAAELLLEQPEEMILSARSFAAKATYTDPISWVGSAASSIRRGPRGAGELADKLVAKGGVANKVLAAGVRAPEVIGQHLMPFVHVSDRVAASITDFIPLSKPAKLAKLIGEQSPEASELIARQVVGGAVAMVGLAWAGQGKLVGAAPKDEKLRNDFYAAGKQPYSVLIGGKWTPIRDLLGPLAGPVVTAAALHDHLQEDPTGSRAEQVMDEAGGTVIPTAKYMLDASYLQTLQDIIGAVEDDRGTWGKGITSAGARVVGGYVPWSGLQRGVATAMDAGEDGRPRVVDREGPVDEIKSGIPGLRQTLPPRLDVLDNLMGTSTGRAGAFLPIVPTENKVADPQLEEHVNRLWYTLQQTRTKLGKTEGQAEAAERGARGEAGFSGADQQLNARAQALRATLPPVAKPTAALDKTLDGVRELEDRVRRLRANKLLSEDVKRDQEIMLQERMRSLMEAALGRLQ